MRPRGGVIFGWLSIRVRLVRPLRRAMDWPVPGRARCRRGMVAALLRLAKVVSGDCPSVRVGYLDLAIAKAADAKSAA